MNTIRETSGDVITRLLSHADLKEGTQVLEPSAGYGVLADGILKHNPNVQLDCVELNKANYDILLSKNHNVVGRDFFQFKSTKKYDYVIGAPNFKDNIDVVHIMKMYEHLSENGTIISLTSPFWMIGNDENQVKFRSWLESKKFYIDMLPDNSFIENGQTVPTAIIVIQKGGSHG